MTTSIKDGGKRNLYQQIIAERTYQLCHVNFQSTPTPPHPASTLPLSLQIYLRLFDFLFVKSRSSTLLPVGFFLIMSKITIHFLKLHTSISVRCLLECLCTITTLWHQFHLKNSRVSLFFSIRLCFLDRWHIS